MMNRMGYWVIAAGVFSGCASERVSRAPSAEPPIAVVPNRLPTVETEEAANPPVVPAARLVAHQEEVVETPSSALFSGPVGVEELVGYALVNNSSIGAARARAQAMFLRVPQASALDDPMLTSTVFLEQIQTAAGPQDVVLSLSQKLPWFGKRTARGEIAYHDAQVAFAELTDAELAVSEQIKLAYYDLYFLDEALVVYRELAKKLEDVIAVTRTRYETDVKQVGLESVLHAEVTLHKLQITVAELEQARLKANARLAKALHLPSGQTLDINPQLQPTLAPQQVEVLVGMLEQCQPQLEACRQAIARDDWSVELAHKDFYPDVNVGINWIEIGDRGLSAVANGRDAYSLMVGVNLPIYKAKRHAALDEALLKVSHSSQQYDAIWDALRADVEKWHATVVEHDRVLKILNDDIVRKSEQTFDLSVEAYRVDRIGFQQLIDSYDDLLRFRVARLMRQSQREQAIAQLERTVGCVIASAPAHLIHDAAEELPAPLP